jgi:hypothetical protein
MRVVNVRCASAHHSSGCPWHLVNCALCGCDPMRVAGLAMLIADAREADADRSRCGWVTLPVGWCGWPWPLPLCHAVPTMRIALTERAGCECLPEGLLIVDGNRLMRAMGLVGAKAPGPRMRVGAQRTWSVTACQWDCPNRADCECLPYWLPVPTVQVPGLGIVGANMRGQPRRLRMPTMRLASSFSSPSQKNASMTS